ncbi:hypothetical protein LCFBJUUZ_CDS0088 [Staphylococcus phage PG-2021_76]|uniref:Uncharacterized protein n=1 Tax=Mammaliicoccus phage MSShimriz1 TaxID=3230127 RepID=A0AAU8GVS9_9VIRU
MVRVKEVMSLTELLEHAWKNNIRYETFYLEYSEYSGVRFDKDGDINFYNREFISKDDRFTVYTEKLPNEDTVFDKVLFRNILGDFREIENFTVKEHKNMAHQVYLMEGDKVGNLLWTREGGFVE